MHVREAIARVCRESATDDGLGLAGDPMVVERLELAGHRRGPERLEAVSCERAATVEQLAGDHAKRELIGAGVDAAPTKLFGGDVGRRPKHRADGDAGLLGEGLGRLAEVVLRLAVERDRGVECEHL